MAVTEHSEWLGYVGKMELNRKRERKKIPKKYFRSQVLILEGRKDRSMSNNPFCCLHAAGMGSVTVSRYVWGLGLGGSESEVLGTSSRLVPHLLRNLWPLCRPTPWYLQPWPFLWIKRTCFEPAVLFPQSKSIEMSSVGLGPNWSYFVGNMILSTYRLGSQLNENYAGFLFTQIYFGH